MTTTSTPAGAGLAAGGPAAPVAIAQRLVTIGFLLFGRLVVATYRGLRSFTGGANR